MSLTSRPASSRTTKVVNSSAPKSIAEANTRKTTRHPTQSATPSTESKAIAAEQPRTPKSASTRATKSPTNNAGITKRSVVIRLMRRRQGATLEALMRATAWQAHSIRGFISGVLRKQQGMAITLTTNADGSRAYRIET